MKQLFLLIIATVLLFTSCEEEDNSPRPEFPVELYIKELIEADTLNPYKGDYYIHVNYMDLNDSGIVDTTLYEADDNIILSTSSGDGLGLVSKGVVFLDTCSGESFDVSFYHHKHDSIFNFYTANYYYSRPWNNTAGANIEFYRPVNDDKDNSSYFRYLGINSGNHYFNIIYIDKNRINGSFKTKWEECCGEHTIYEVTGDFSIPLIPLH